jgi:3-hydroxyisobutyrate dehydrogenase
MTKIAFLSLGMMGTPMATRLLGAGQDLAVWDRTDEGTSRRSVPSASSTGILEHTDADIHRGLDSAVPSARPNGS